MQKNRRVVYTVILFSVIAVCLGAILALLPDQQPGGEAASRETVTGEESASESRDYTTAVPGKPEEKEVPPEVPIEEEKAAAGGKLYIIIDDVGNNLSDLKYFLNVQVPVTFAVMPERTFSGTSVKMLKEAGFDVILHQPMEPVGDFDPGVGAIKTGMNKEQIYRILEKNLQGLEGARGINNHMGSKATADKEVMTAVMSYLKQKDMFFLDSVTTDKSVAQEIAVSLGVPFARRNAIFLDNDGDKKAIESAFLSGTRIASANGSAIMIGHLKSRALADVINEMSGKLKASGYSFYGISSLFDEGGGF